MDFLEIWGAIKMCNPTTKRNASEVQQRLDNIRRPMRYGSKKTEPIANTTIGKIGNAWIRFVTKATGSITGSKSFSELDEIPEGDGVISKAFEDNEINDIDRDFDNEFGRSTSIDMEQAAREFINEVVGASGAAQIGTNPAILDLMYYLTIIAAGETATRLAKKAWDRLANYLKKKIPWIGGQYVYDGSQLWIKAMHKEGYQLVTSALTRTFLPGLKRDMVRMAREGIPHNTVARELRKKYGAKLYHWERLVRSEMATAIDKTSTRRYKELGVEFEQWSLGNGACPICSGIRNTANVLDSGDPDRGFVEVVGVWRIGDGPSVTGDTHPNCRCFKTPLFRI